MADHQIGAITGIASRTRASAREVKPVTNMDSIANMRARLQTINATLYTNAYLNTMTENDMRYAIRLADQAGTI